jgi:hypothetical protein
MEHGSLREEDSEQLLSRLGGASPGPAAAALGAAGSGERKALIEEGRRRMEEFRRRVGGGATDGASAAAAICGLSPAPPSGAAAAICGLSPGAPFGAAPSNQAACGAEGARSPAASEARSPFAGACQAPASVESLTPVARGLREQLDKLKKDELDLAASEWSAMSARLASDAAAHESELCELRAESARQAEELSRQAEEARAQALDAERRVAAACKERDALRTQVRSLAGELEARAREAVDRLASGLSERDADAAEQRRVLEQELEQARGRERALEAEAAQQVQQAQQQAQTQLAQHAQQLQALDQRCAALEGAAEEWRARAFELREERDLALDEGAKLRGLLEDARRAHLADRQQRQAAAAAAAAAGERRAAQLEGELRAAQLALDKERGGVAFLEQRLRAAGEKAAAVELLRQREVAALARRAEPAEARAAELEGRLADRDAQLAAEERRRRGTEEALEAAHQRHAHELKEQARQMQDTISELRGMLERRSAHQLGTIEAIGQSDVHVLHAVARDIDELRQHQHQRIEPQPVTASAGAGGVSSARAIASASAAADAQLLRALAARVAALEGAEQARSLAYTERMHEQAATIHQLTVELEQHRLAFPTAEHLRERLNRSGMCEDAVEGDRSIELGRGDVGGDVGADVSADVGAEEHDEEDDDEGYSLDRDVEDEQGEEEEEAKERGSAEERASPTPCSDAALARATKTERELQRLRAALLSAQKHRAKAEDKSSFLQGEFTQLFVDLFSQEQAKAKDKLRRSKAKREHKPSSRATPVAKPAGSRKKTSWS